ncbi:MAG: hypothetical protein SFY66_15475 [Oculatellaceae cyanobacterium bins.114]|nr:hypothetical protein [Oculatellaceae cyanobacterium bins.114]
MDSSETDLDQLIEEIRQSISTDQSLTEAVRSLQQRKRQEHGVDPVWDELLAKLDDYFLG